MIFFNWIKRLFKKPNPPAPAKPLVSLFPKQEWTDYMLQLVRSSKLPHTPVAETWFTNTPENWVHLFAAMAKYESSFKPTSTYTESFKDSNGNYIISTGLFQISQESARGYGFKVTTDQLMDPFLNMEIAVAIMEKWVLKDGCIAGDGKPLYKGGARYWSVLRASGKLAKVKELYEKCV